jgi:hypothetical protein
MVINDLTRQLPHFGITCPVKPEMNSPLKFLRNMTAPEASEET